MKRHSYLSRFVASSISISALAAAAASAPAAASTPAPLPASAVAQMNTLIQQKEARTPAQRKISSQLLYAKDGTFKNTVKSTAAATGPGQLTSLMQIDNAGRVLVDIKGDLGGGLERRVQDVLGTIVSTSAAHNAVRAWVPMAKLEKLAAQPVVQIIRPALRAHTTFSDPPGSPAKFHMTREQRIAALQKYLKDSASSRTAAARKAATGASAPARPNAGAVSSEGSAAQGADQARKFYGVDGTGANVGVISDSDDYKEAAISSGDLPASTVTVPGQSGRPGTGEGTAMMEIVHDVAPGAALFFASAFESPEAFAENIRTLRFTYHCDVIVDDVGYYFESPFGDDIVAAAVNDVVADGAVYLSSAGNDGSHDDGTTGTWEGDFVDGGTLSSLPSGYSVHSYPKKVISNRVEAAGDPVYLHWSDPGSLDSPASTNDYDLFVLSNDLRDVLIASTDIQDGTNIPFEFIDATIPVNARLVIAKKAGAQARGLRLQLSRGELGVGTTGATYGHATSKAALGVAAVDVAEAVNGSYPAGPTTPVELFSSDGLRRVFYDQYGHLIKGTSVLLSGPGGETRRKPDITGSDGVTTTLPGTSGLNPFFGTSAAAPHDAGIAALLRSAVPAATGKRITNALRTGSFDIEQAGYDRNAGYGITSAMNSLSAVGAKPAVFLELASVTAVGNGGGSINPGSAGATLTTTVANNGGAGATAVAGTLGTSSPYVTIQQGTSAFPDLPPGSSAANSTPYTFDVSSDVPCGSKLNFSESINYTGQGPKPFTFPVAVQTGAPDPSSQVTTDYTGGAVPIPDGNATGVNIPITLTNIGLLAKLAFRIDGDTCSAAPGATTNGVDHSWVGDLTMLLTSPSGTVVKLMDRPGGINNSGNNFCKTLLTDDAATSIQNIAIAAAPWTASFQPAQPLSSFAGENANGTWILHVTDSVTIDTGNVRHFSIDTSGFTCTP